MLFGRGLLKLLFATETFAVGINMPTKTVVFTGYRKYDDAVQGMRMLNTDEYIQMAGRAGRRGKDDKGLVLYLPDREPESADDVKRMMTGARQTFQSRMNFHYDFLLKTIQLGKSSWIDLMKQSYWYRRHLVTLEAARKELAALESKGAASITDAERAAMEEYDRLQVDLKGSVNAARKAAQKAWDAWDRSHLGPRWHSLQKEIWPASKKVVAEIASLRAEIAGAEVPETDVWPSLRALASFGYLEEPVEEMRLTQLGTMATEVNEGHPIMMPALFQKRELWENMGAPEIVATLACFLAEGKEEDAPSLGDLAIPETMKTALRSLQSKAYEFRRLEETAGAPPPPKHTFWDLRFDWVEPIYRWLSDSEMEMLQICNDYGVYSGNVTRVLLKVGNLLEEWRSLASLATDVFTLDKLRDVEKTLFRGVTMGESLYLKT
jgi:superfamily II RNA helicase